jgi:hypothetical protein
MARLNDHVKELVTVIGLGDPPPPDAIKLFNRLLAEARSSKGRAPWCRRSRISGRTPLVVSLFSGASSCWSR